MLNLTKRFVFSLLILILLSGCQSFFTGHFDTNRLNNLTTLKAMHLKFLETWTEGSGTTWNEQKLMDACDQIDTNFRAAYEYAKSTDLEDGTAEKAVSLLWQQFKNDCSASLEDKALFKSLYFTDIKPRVEGNYNKAIEGEKSRIGYNN